MKRVLLALVMGVSLALVSCADDPKQKTDEANKHMQDGIDLANQGINEFNAAYKVELNKTDVEPDLSKWNDEDLQGLKKRYLAAIGKLQMGYSYLEKALDIAKDHKDSKAQKDTWINSMYKIKNIIGEVEDRIKNIELAISAKQNQITVKISKRSRQA